MFPPDLDSQIIPFVLEFEQIYTFAKGQEGTSLLHFLFSIYYIGLKIVAA